MRTRRKAKAYHEAGHAVVARVLGVSVAYATRLAADAEGTPGVSFYTLRAGHGLPSLSLRIGAGWSHEREQQTYPLASARMASEPILFTLLATKQSNDCPESSFPSKIHS
jgi:hypothetical protein